MVHVIAWCAFNPVYHARVYTHCPFINSTLHVVAGPAPLKKSARPWHPWLYTSLHRQKTRAARHACLPGNGELSWL